MKCKVGDKVRVIGGWDSIVGCIGTVMVAGEEYHFPYNITIHNLPPLVADSGEDNWLMLEDELELVTDEL